MVYTDSYYERLIDHRHERLLLILKQTEESIAVNIINFEKQNSFMTIVCAIRAVKRRCQTVMLDIPLAIGSLARLTSSLLGDGECDETSFHI